MTADRTCTACNAPLSDDDRYAGPEYPEVGWEFYDCPACGHIQNATSVEEPPTRTERPCPKHGLERMPTLFDERLCPTCYGNRLEDRIDRHRHEINTYLMFAAGKSFKDIGKHHGIAPETAKEEIKQVVWTLDEAGLATHDATDLRAHLPEDVPPE